MIYRSSPEEVINSNGGHPTQVILPSTLVPPDGQKRILNAKNCCLYLRPASLADQVGVLLKGTPHIQAITVPEIGHFMQETEATRFTYPKTWEDGKDDPWLVFHTSGTTGELSDGR